MKRQLNITSIIYQLFFLLLSTALYSQEYNILRQTTGMTGGSSTIQLNNQDYHVQQSIGQASVIGSFSTSNSTLRQGFIQPNVLLLRHISNEELKITIYPNPFRASISMELEEDLNTYVDLKIFDITGRVVYVHNYSSFSYTELNLSFLRSGSYVIQIQSDNKLFSAQIQKI